MARAKVPFPSSLWLDGDIGIGAPGPVAYQAPPFLRLVAGYKYENYGDTGQLLELPKLVFHN
jgi:hypothetical protein